MKATTASQSPRRIARHNGGVQHTLLHMAPDKTVTPCIGIDEAGRGCLAGPVVAGAVFAPEGFDFHLLRGLTDSKKLSPAARARLALEIRASKLIWSVGFSWPQEIDSVNILNATFRAMSRAAKSLWDRMPLCTSKNEHQQPTSFLHWPLLYIDGPWPIRADAWHLVMQTPPPRQQPVIQGDMNIPAISAASIMAKTVRDHIMTRLDARYPQYGFTKHKGYGTKEHLHALTQFGPCPLHRRSFQGTEIQSEQRQGNLI